MDGGIDHHRVLVWIDVHDLLVHVKEVSVTLGHAIPAKTLDGLREIEEHGQARVVNAKTMVRALLGGT